jgi:DNA-binding transcriptional LysR family regulator
VGEEWRRGTLKKVLAAYTRPELGIHAVWSQRAYVPPKVHAIVECLTAQFDPKPERARA